MVASYKMDVLRSNLRHVLSALLSVSVIVDCYAVSEHRIIRPISVERAKVQLQIHFLFLK